MEVMYANNVVNAYLNEKSFTGFYGELSDLKVFVKNIDSIKINMNKKVKSFIGNQDDSFKALGLNKSILNKKISELSFYEFKTVLLIKNVLMNPQFIILNNFDLGINDKYKSKVSRFIKTVNATYHINFIIISNNLIFINKCTKHFICMKNGIVKHEGDIIGALKKDIIPKPPIIKFIDMANDKGADLDYTLDNKELLKGIYRSVF